MSSLEYQAVLGGGLKPGVVITLARRVREPSNVMVGESPNDTSSVNPLEMKLATHPVVVVVQKMGEKNVQRR